MTTTKFQPGSLFPDIKVKAEDGREVSLVDVDNRPGEVPAARGQWTLVLVYRGAHCPICLNYLNEASMLTGRLQAANVKVVGVSADTKAQLDEFRVKGMSADFPIYLGLSVAQMQQLGLYISEPVSDSETDHPFPEPALFLVRPDMTVQLVEIANAPFIRPNLDQLVSGIEYLQENDYPIRGTHA